MKTQQEIEELAAKEYWNSNTEQEAINKLKEIVDGKLKIK